MAASIHAAPAGTAGQPPSIFTTLSRLVRAAEAAGVPPAELREARAVCEELHALTSAVIAELNGLAAAEWALSSPEPGSDEQLHAELIARRMIVQASRELDRVQARMTGVRLGYFDAVGGAMSAPIPDDRGDE